MLPNRIKIAHFLSSRLESLSGGDLVILNLLKYLNKNKFESWVINFYEARKPGLSLMIKTAQERNIKTFLIDTKWRFDFRTIRQTQRFLIDSKIDILHCHGYKADVIGSLASRRLGIKKITTLHGWWIGKNPKLKFYNWLDFFMIRNFDKIITVSEPMKALLTKRRFSSDKIIYIPNGVDLEQMHSADSQKIRKELGFAKDTLILGTAGRISKEKGHQYLLEAVKDIPDVVLLIVGSGPLQNQLAALADKFKIKGRVVFTGFRYDVHDFIAAMDIFVLPSLTEGLPLALLEAMAAQKPIIASNVGGIPTVIKNQETGILVEPKNPSLLKEAIIHLSKDKSFANQIAINARKLVEHNFSLKLATRRYEEIYLEITKERR